MILYILAGLAIVALALIVVIAAQPSEFRVKRSATIPAPAAEIFPHVNELRKWEDWSPWVKLDPNAKTTFEGPPSGAGSSQTWNGNKNVGEGRMTIVESQPHDFIRFKLEFVRPFAGTSDVEFTFKPDGNGTRVIWTMTGKNNFIAKAISLFMNCDKMVGGQFEEGLASLSKVVQSEDRP